MRWMHKHCSQCSEQTELLRRIEHRLATAEKVAVRSDMTLKVIAGASPSTIQGELGRLARKGLSA